MAIEIFSGKTQPFGLLSNNALVPIVLDGERWTSVTEYVYTNLFTSDEIRAKMRRLCNRDPFPAAVELMNQEDESTYSDAIILGMRARFAQDAQLLGRLRAIRGPIRVLSDNADEARRLHTLFRQLIHDPLNVFYDEKYGEVSFAEVNAVVAGAIDQLTKNPNFENLPFSELRRYAQKNAPPKRDLVGALDNLDEIVPLLKIKLRNVIYAAQVARFKTYLLDVVLDYLLETRYPRLARADYALAKRQQIRKNESTLERYKDQLYDLYAADDMPLEIVRRLTWEPLIPDSDRVTSDRLERVGLIADTALAGDAYEIHGQSEFLPAYPASVRVGGKTWRSVVAYAYSVLFDRLGIVDADVNSYDLPELVRRYGEARNFRLAEAITQNNEKATTVKFRDDSLRALLLATGQQKLVWADRTDQVLGIGGIAPNRAGSYLEFIRANSPVPSATVSHPLDNVVFARWFSSRAEDYANTLSMFRVKSTGALEIVYGRSAAPVESITPATSSVLNNAGLDANEQIVVIPLIAAEFTDLTRGSNSLVDATTAMVRFYDETRPSAATKLAAENKLLAIFERVKSDLLPSVNGAPINGLYFAAIILSNQPVIEFKQKKWWRINYWASV